MVKNWKKRIVALVLAFAVVFAGVASVHIEADAANTYMKKLGVKFGLKEGQAYTFTQEFAGIGKKNFTWTMTEYKKENAKKAGYKKISFVLTYQQDFKPTPTEVDQVVFSEYSQKYQKSGVEAWFAIADAQNGLDLENKNKYKVKVTSKNLGYEENQYFGTDSDTWQYVTSQSRKKVTVVYPKDYKNLCIGFGGGNVLYENETQADNGFWDGSVPFGKTTFYKKGKTNSRWMMVK